MHQSAVATQTLPDDTVLDFSWRSAALLEHCTSLTPNTLHLTDPNTQHLTNPKPHRSVQLWKRGGRAAPRRTAPLGAGRGRQAGLGDGRRLPEARGPKGQRGPREPKGQRGARGQRGPRGWSDARLDARMAPAGPRPAQGGGARRRGLICICSLIGCLALCHRAAARDWLRRGRRRGRGPV